MSLGAGGRGHYRISIEQDVLAKGIGFEEER
jgi:hypothetical protein